MNFCFTKRTILPYQKIYKFQSTNQSYRVIGKGKPVILLHGSMVNNPWMGFENLLAKRYRVYLPDLPGFGASDSIDGELHDTDLFARALCVFIKETNLTKTTIIGFSLGTIISVKTATSGCTQGKLILVGLPGKISGWNFQLTSHIPVSLRRLLVSTNFGKAKLLIPILRKNIGKADKTRDAKLLEDLSYTSVQSLVDLDMRKEIEKDMPYFFSRIKNKVVLIYGENDPLRKTVSHLEKKYKTIPRAEHNIFRTNPEETLKVLINLI